MLPINHRIEEAFARVLAEAVPDVQVIAASNRDVIGEPTRVVVTCRKCNPVVAGATAHYADVEIMLATMLDDATADERSIAWQAVLRRLCRPIVTRFADLKLDIRGYTTVDVSDDSDGQQTIDLAQLRAGVQDWV